MKTKRRTSLIIAVLLAIVAVAGVSAAAPESARAADGVGVKKCGGGTILLNAAERKVFALHNEIRREHNLPVFCVHPNLQRAARAHSRDMIQRQYASHNTKGGGTCEQRLRGFGYDPAGYSYYAFGENIAYGDGPWGEPDSIMRFWMRSKDHRRNILAREFREIGIGSYTGEFKGVEDVTMYTADFGVRRR